jgi:pyrimidine operon attenuation protein / uracil phosphoribosyltransferase
MSQTKKLILDHSRIAQIIRRMAHQIFESTYGHKEVILVGVGGGGTKLCALLGEELRLIQPKLKVTCQEVLMDKENPLGTTRLNADPTSLKGKPVVLVDDVLNTGRTLAYGLTELLKIDVDRIEIAVLVNRRHTTFPVAATYSGYELSTTLDEHIEVVMGKKPAVYLY